MSSSLYTGTVNLTEVKFIHPISKSDISSITSRNISDGNYTFKKTDKTHHLLAAADGKVTENGKGLQLKLKTPVKVNWVILNNRPEQGVITHIHYQAFNGSGTQIKIDYGSGFDGGDVSAADVIGELKKETKILNVTVTLRGSAAGNNTLLAANAAFNSDSYKLEDGRLLGGGSGGSGSSSGGSGGATSDATDTGSTSGSNRTPGEIATAAAFSTYFQMPSLMETEEAMMLTGRRSLLNDKPLLPFVQQIAAGSLRSIMSLPNGDFYAFYPDYFGGLGKTPYWVIRDIEIISGKIDLSDDQLVTHMYVVGDTQPAQGNPLGYGSIDWIDKINTAGVVNVFNAFMADFVNGPESTSKATATEDAMASNRPSLANKIDAIKFLRKYGARPKYEEAPAVRSPIYETFVAYQKFCLAWAKQFQTTFEFTFMPELYPGGLVEFPDHGLQCYIERVVHSGSYETGFTTIAELSAPAAIRDKSGNPVDPNKSWVHAGMIRAWPGAPAGEVSGGYDDDTTKTGK